LRGPGLRALDDWQVAGVRLTGRSLAHLTDRAHAPRWRRLVWPGTSPDGPTSDPSGLAGCVNLRTLDLTLAGPQADEGLPWLAPLRRLRELTLNATLTRSRLA